MKLIWKYKFTLLLAALIAVGWSGVGKIISPADSVEASGSARTTITVEEIRRMLEMNGATAEAKIRTDTTFTSLSTNELLGVKLNVPVKLWETEKVHRLIEHRKWLIKAGTSDFDLRKTENAYTLYIHPPKVTSREHVTEEYRVEKRVGIWNPVLLKQLELQSRDKAVARVIDQGLLTEAKLCIENELYRILPPDVSIVWKE